MRVTFIFVFCVSMAACNESESSAVDMGAIDAAQIDMSSVDAAVSMDAMEPDATIPMPLTLDDPTVIDLPNLPPLSIQPSVALGADGEIAVSWCGSEAEDLGIWFSLLNPDGSVRVEPYQLETTSVGIQNEPDICPLPGGGYAVAWSMDAQEVNADGQNLYLRYRVVGADGQPSSATDLEVSAPHPGNRWLAEIACDPAGGFVIAGTGSEPNMTFGAFAQRFDVNGNPSGAAIPLNAEPEGAQTFPSVAVGPDGTTVIAWENQTGFGTDRITKEIVLRRFENTDLAIGTEEIIITDPDVEAARPEVSIDPVSGNILVGATIDQRRLGLYSLSADDETVNVIEGPEGINYYPAISPIGDGRFAMLSLNGFASDVTVRATILGPEGNIEEMADLTTGALPPYPTTAHASDGRLVVGWTERTTGNGYRIRLAVFGQP